MLIYFGIEIVLFVLCQRKENPQNENGLLVLPNTATHWILKKEFLHFMIPKKLQNP
jgi:hypothetical protein